MTVLSTTRTSAKSGALTGAGADHILIDDGDVARQVRQILPAGADTALELVGTPTLPDTLRSVRVHGVVCFTGMLSNQWTVRDFSPFDYLPRGVRLTAYGGDAADLPADLLQGYLDDVAAGRAVVPVGHVYRFDQTVQAPGLLTWSEIWCDVENSKSFRSSCDRRVSPGHRLKAASALHNYLALIFSAPGVATWNDIPESRRKNQVTRPVTLCNRSTMSSLKERGRVKRGL
ncbi:MAG TPA: zinc-binding dehydrogenase [Streptosporangiaceae bacterium]|nr:zinc-binding dehydrogenase [Streptosporangiaceae bacterium]